MGRKGPFRVVNKGPVAVRFGCARLSTCLVRPARRPCTQTPPPPRNHAWPPPGTPRPRRTPLSGGSGLGDLLWVWRSPRTPSHHPITRRSSKSAEMAPGVGHRNPLRSVGLNTEVVFPSRAPIAQMCRVGLGGGGVGGYRTPCAVGGCTWCCGLGYADFKSHFGPFWGRFGS